MSETEVGILAFRILGTMFLFVVAMVLMFIKDDVYWPPTEKEKKRQQRIALASLVLAAAFPIIGEYIAIFGALALVIWFFTTITKGIIRSIKIACSK